MSKSWIQEQKTKLNQISPSACLAKFYEVSLHLESGHNHSCVHPPTHKVSVEEIQRNVHALHNSEYKKSIREQMLQGERPSECSYCWRVEDANKDAMSDRIGLSGYLSSHNGGDGRLTSEIINHGSDYDYSPRHIEVSFSTTCNFKCTYCSPFVSSRWMKDIQKHGAFPGGMQNISKANIFTDKMPIKKDNPYVDAFWKWLPEVYSNLRQLRVTGGEPLLDSNTFKLLDWIQQHPSHDLDLGINSNLGVPTKLFSRFINKITEFAQLSPVKTFTVWTSGESTHDQFEYIRLGGNYQQWLDNITQLLKINNVNVRIMTTYSLLSVTSYLEFMQDIYTLIKQYPNRIILDTHTYLQYPGYLNIDILTDRFVPVVQQQVEFVKEMHSQKLATDVNVIHAEQLLLLLENSLQYPAADLSIARQEFYQYITEFDRRNGLDFKITFPELAEFYDSCNYDR